MTAESLVRDELATELAKTCERHHLVVWDDPAGSYGSVVESVVPDGWRLERYEGSWWELRRRIEEPFSGATPPKLVVYIPAKPLAEDPLAEIRRAAGRYDRRLDTLLSHALEGELSAARIAELAAKCPTLQATEEALIGNDQLDPRLVRATGAHDAETVLVALLIGDLGDRVQHEPDLFGMVADLCQSHLGVAPDRIEKPDELSGAVARHILVGDLARCLGDDDVRALDATWRPLTAAQQRNLTRLSNHLGHAGAIARWGELADLAATALRLGELGWDDRLAECDIIRTIDDLAFAEAARRLRDDPRGARDLAARRAARSRWLRWRDAWSGRALADFDGVRAVAKLRIALEAHPTPESTRFDDVLGWYANGAWSVDRAQRVMEGCRTGLSRPGLDAELSAARDAYVAWLDQLLRVTNTAAASDASTRLVPQAEVYRRHVAGQGKAALLIVDALRLEAGHRLVEQLEGVADGRAEAAIAAVPTVTAVGMANLLPSAADEGVGVEVDSDNLVVEVGGSRLTSVDDRTADYRRAAGRVEDHPLRDWLDLGQKALAKRVAGADLVVVRSQEIDAAGESGMAGWWAQVDYTIERLALLVGRLANAGVAKVVVTADHGFLALGQPLDPSRCLPPPTGSGKVEHGRAWVGSPSTVPDGCTVLPLSDLSIRSSASIVVPDGMTVFGRSGSAFFHGGISPQEIVVPVVLLEPRPVSTALVEREVQVTVPGGRISAQAFSISVALAGSLLSSEVTVRITAAGPGTGQVARLVPGESVDPNTGTVRLDPTEEATILTFLVTENVDKDSNVDVAVLDASTGRELASTRVTVVRDLRPQEEW